jgi:hypothetical protein
MMDAPGREAAATAWCRGRIERSGAGAPQGVAFLENMALVDRDDNPIDQKLIASKTEEIDYQPLSQCGVPR